MGRKEHQKVTVIGAYPSLSTRLLGGEYIDNIPSGGDLYATIKAPEGYIARVKGLSVGYNGFGASTGRMAISLLSGGSNFQFPVGLGYGEKNVYTVSEGGSAELLYKHGMWFNADYMVYPISQEVQQRLWLDYPIDDTNGIRVAWLNRSEKSDGGAKKYIWIWAEIEKVVS